MTEKKKTPTQTVTGLSGETPKLKTQDGNKPFQSSPAPQFSNTKKNIDIDLSSPQLPGLPTAMSNEYELQSDKTVEDKEKTKNISSTLERMLNLLDETSNSLAEREQMFQALAEVIPSPVLVHHNFRILYANKATAELVGVSQKDLMQREITDFSRPDEMQQAFDLIKQKHAGKDISGSYLIHIRNRFGEYVPHKMQIKIVSYRGLQTIINVCTDISNKQTSIDTPKEVKHHLGQMLNALSTALYTTNENGIITQFNNSAEVFIGASAKQVIGKHSSLVLQLVSAEDESPISDPVSQVLQEQKQVMQEHGVLLQVSGDNSYKPVSYKATPIYTNDNRIRGVAVELLNEKLTSTAENELLTYQATHDSLTGLINRREFENRLHASIQDMQDGIAKHVLFYIDLNRFKPVNDKAGHQAGDEVLKQVARKLRDVVRESDSIGRLGGDEFGVLLKGCPLEKAKEIAQDLCESVPAHRFTWNEHVFNIGLSVGIVQLTNKDSKVSELLNAADTACYIAKASNSSSYHLFKQEDVLVKRDQGSIVWRKRINDALNFNGFELFLQKIKTIDSVTNVLPINPSTSLINTTIQRPSYEVNVRMIDNFGTMYRPELFLPSARQYGLLSSIDRLVVENTFDAMDKGYIKVAEDECCSINLSAETFSDEEFLFNVVEALDEYSINPKNLCFEVPEPDVIANLDAAKRFINVLNDLGCQFALDDFGRELQSFSYLRELNIHYLKLDDFYVRTIVEDEVNRAMVAAMIKLAHSLGMQVIAEQVERIDVLNILAELGADFAQGNAVAPVIHLHDVT